MMFIQGSTTFVMLIFKFPVLSAHLVAMIEIILYVRFSDSRRNLAMHAS